MAEKERIGVLGGTFDPVHFGHLQMAERVRERYGMAAVIFLPCQVSPHKLGRTITDARDRVEMIKRAIAGKEWMKLSEIELERSGPSYSYETVESLETIFPKAQLYWIMGADQWKALPTWKRPEVLAAKLEFIVVARDGELPQAREGYRASWVVDEHPASSTEIRASYQRGVPVTEWLAPGVAAWIEERGLYRSGTSE